MDSIWLFRSLTPEQRATLSRKVTPVVFHDGDVLTLAPRNGTVCESVDDIERIEHQLGDGFYW